MRSDALDEWRTSVRRAPGEACAGEVSAAPGSFWASGAKNLALRLVILSAYGVGFTVLRSASASWATHRLFSVWFPAAGLRFAFLWLAGARWSPAAAAAELVVSVGTGTVELSNNLALSLLGVVSPCLIYGVVIAAVRARPPANTDNYASDPLPFGIAAVLGPIAACVGALPWALPLAMERGGMDAPLLLSSMLVFTLGDLLGILILAPPLIWLSYRIRFGRWSAAPPSALTAARLAELTTLNVFAWSMFWLLRRLGDGPVLAPVLLAACWCGLRGGRVVASATIVTTALIVLPITGAGVSDAIRVQLHMQLACVAVGAYLAGSYADAQARAIMEIERRDRMLLRAERLKTLRAMSLAIIHEVSQPLSTIAIEARALADLSQSERTDRAETWEIASLIARKADDLSTLIRRLRAFGSGTDDRRSAHSLGHIVSEVLGLAEPEAQNAQVTIACVDGPELKVCVNDLELRQAMLNLVRNAIAAAPKPCGVVKIGWSASEDGGCFWVENDVANRRSAGGMGLGLIISRTIAQAHGGRLAIETLPTGTVRSTIHLPSDEGLEE